jgi:hypothetical protein
MQGKDAVKSRMWGGVYSATGFCNWHHTNACCWKMKSMDMRHSCSSEVTDLLGMPSDPELNRKHSRSDEIVQKDSNATRHTKADDVLTSSKI